MKMQRYRDATENLQMCGMQCSWVALEIMKITIMKMQRYGTENLQMCRSNAAE